MASDSNSAGFRDDGPSRRRSSRPSISTSVPVVSPTNNTPGELNTSFRGSIGSTHRRAFHSPTAPPVSESFSSTYASRSPYQALPPIHASFGRTSPLGRSEPSRQSITLPSIDLRIRAYDSSAQRPEPALEHPLLPPGKRRRVDAPSNIYPQSGYTDVASHDPSVHPYHESSNTHSLPLLPAVPTSNKIPHRPSIDENACCRPGCTGHSCTAVRNLIVELVEEVLEREIATSGFSGSAPQAEESPIPYLRAIPFSDALAWAVSRLKHNNRVLRETLAVRRPSGASIGNPTADASHRSPSTSATSGQDARRYEGGEQGARGYIHRSIFGPSRSVHGLDSPLTETSWATSERGEPGGSLQHHRPPPTPYQGIGAQASPMTDAQSARLLPTPTSMNLPAPTGLGSPVNSTFSSAARASHLQDLQHQVSVKTLANQTLQREYDSLLQKLERQRLRSTAMEKKTEVTDIEIINLTDDKERLEKQVAALEKQILEANAARDEARKSSSEQASQYMKIMEMGGKLNERAAEERKTWETERTALNEKIRLLEKVRDGLKAAQQPSSIETLDIPKNASPQRDETQAEETKTPVSSTSSISSNNSTTKKRSTADHAAEGEKPTDKAEPRSKNPDATAASSSTNHRERDRELIKKLKSENKMLMGRITHLELALRGIQKENEKMGKAAMRLLDSGQMTNKILGEILDVEDEEEGLDVGAATVGVGTGSRRSPS